MMAWQVGVLRSLLIYYAIPGRRRRMRRFYRQFVQPGDLCFDIGAHLGNHIRAWLDLGARVVAVEPQQHLLTWLERFYGRHPQVTLLPQAVGAAEGTAALYISQRTPTVSTLSASWMKLVGQDRSFADVVWETAVPVPVTTLDRLIEQYGRPAFTKIDVEGYELEVLQGLSQPLPALSFEYIAAVKEMTLSCLERLEQLGNYEFNYSTGESYRLVLPDWVDVAKAAGVLSQLAEGSGDVYGRLARRDA